MRPTTLAPVVNHNEPSEAVAMFTTADPDGYSTTAPSGVARANEPPPSANQTVPSCPAAIGPDGDMAAGERAATKPAAVICSTERCRSPVNHIVPSGAAVIASGAIEAVPNMLIEIPAAVAPRQTAVTQQAAATARSATLFTGLV